MNDDEAEEVVRRLLADARATEAMPTDVQARLDGVLDDLSAERVAASRSETVVALPSRNRRRRARSLLIAAAAVTVVGFGLNGVLQSGLSSSDDSMSASDTAAEEEADEGGDAGGALRDAPESASEPANAEAALPRVRPDNFAADAEAARDQAARTDLSAFTPLDPTCLAGSELTADLIQQGRAIPVRYGRRNAALVLSEADNGSQQVTLYVCGDSSPRRTAVLPAQ